MTLTASDVASLKCALGRWELAEYISTTFVFLGCMGEFFAEFTPFPKTERHKHKLARLSLILVIGGIAGELCATVRTSQLSGSIIASVEENAGNAQYSADNAAKAAGRANNEADSAKAKADAIGAEARLLRKQGMKLVREDLSMESRLTTADEALEDEKEKRLKLAASLMPREVFDQSGIIAELRRLPPHRIVFVYPDESEPRQLAEQIAMVFSMLHWPFFGRQISSDDLPTGVSVCAGHKLPPPELHPTDREIDVANEELMGTEDIIDPIVKAFSARGVKASRKFVGYMIKELPTTLVIGVGEKSNAEAQEALRELGTPNPTPLRIGTSSVLMESGDRMRIPPETPTPPTRPPDAKIGKP